MKKMNRAALIALILFFTTIILGGCSKRSEDAALTYKEFMDYWIVHDYTMILPYTTGEAAAVVEPHTQLTSQAWNKTIKRNPGGYGKVEASKIKILSQDTVAEDIVLEVTYSASISWDGRTANPLSPKSWQRFKQTATLEQISGEWKVASFSGDDIDNRMSNEGN